MKRKRLIKPIAAPIKRIMPADRRTVKRLMSMQTTAAFKSQIEVEYVNANLNKQVLSGLFAEVNASSFPLTRKRIMLAAITVYNSKF